MGTTTFEDIVVFSAWGLGAASAPKSAGGQPAEWDFRYEVPACYGMRRDFPHTASGAGENDLERNQVINLIP